MPTPLQKTKIYYDALGRPVRTVNPNGSEQWAFQGIPDDIVTPVNPSLLSGVEAFTPTPWENYAYDSNDLADIVVVPNNNVPSTHYGTPKNSLVDALGRTTKTKEFFDNTDSTNVIEMNYFFDIRGNLLLVKDPYNRNVFEHVYDFANRTLWTKHIDKGISTVWFDAVGKPIRGDDAKGAVVLSSYDVISRPKNSWASNKTGDTITLRGYTVYGEIIGSGSNLNGKAYESYDEAGKLSFPSYDFKGNLLSKVREVIDDSELKSALSSFTNYIVDWDTPPTLLAMNFETDMAYDALNRITELTLPEDLDLERKKIIPTYNTAGALEKVDLYSPAGPTTTNYVENIAYNAKGQRLLIAFGNDMMTRYTYDPITFRLLRQRTEGYTKSVVGSTITYTYGAGTNKQDDAFNFDLVGNIVNIFTRVTDCGIGGNPDELDRVFEYDPIYRLTYADGRESDTQSGNTYLYDDAPIPSTPLPSNVNYYERNFVYDKLGNIESVVQSGTNGFTRDYTYNSGKNTLQKIENATPTVIESYTYDSNGNTLTTNLNRYYYWNHSDQLLCYKNQAGMSNPTVFTQYDYAGQDRVSKMVRTGNDYERTIYIDGIFEYIWLENISGKLEKNYIHIMDDKSRIAEVRINPGTPFPGDITDDIVYTLEDQIGSSVVRLNTSGTVIDKEEYYPFGDSSLRTFTYKRYRYVGKERDAESGLYYYGARYYAAWTCRFISVDPLAADYPHLTPYNYAGNKPIGDYDIDGMQGTGDQKTGGSSNVPSGSAIALPTGMSYSDFFAPATSATSTPSPRPRGDLFKGSVEGFMHGANPLAGVKDMKENVAQSFKSVENSTKFWGEIAANASTLGLYGVVKSQFNFVKNIVEGNTRAVGFQLGNTVGQGGVAVVAGGINEIRTSPIELQSKFAQPNHSNNYSKKGQEILGVKSIPEGVDKLLNKEWQPNKLPIDYVVRDNTQYLLNTRSIATLIEAKVPKSSWVFENKTGNTTFEKNLTNNLNGSSGFLEVYNRTTGKVTKLSDAAK